MTFCFVESLPKSVTFPRKASLLASCRCYLVEIMLLVPLWQSWWLSGVAKKKKKARRLFSSRGNLMVFFFCVGVTENEL